MSSSDDIHFATLPLGEAGEPPSPGTRYALVVYHRDGAEVAPLRPGYDLVVGRVPPADLVIPDGSLSRAHASFKLLGEGVMMRDLGSTNGSWVGGKSVKMAALEPGDMATLGAVTAVIQKLGSETRLGLDGHDRFAALLEREVTRGWQFARPLAVAMVRSAAPQAPLHSWVQRVIDVARPVDSVALYSPSCVEVLLPETDASAAVAWARKLVDARPDEPLHCAVSAYPDAATTADQLIESCVAALRDTRVERSVCAAPSAVIHQSTRTPGVGDVIAYSSAMKEVLALAERVARAAIPVLLSGETGTGKEVLARHIHDQSPRASAPLIAVNCAAIPAQLVESILFGHEKGAFTGANQAHAGVFEAADGGTLLMDEIGELPAAVQAVLLRVLETKTITRVGSTKEQAVNVRIITATHRDLEAMSDAGTFREDLLYRLNAVTIDIPPLRERKADILLLAYAFLKEACKQNGRPPMTIAPEVQAALERHPWRGNIRELRNAIERAVVIAEHDVIGLRELPRQLRDGTYPSEECVMSTTTGSEAPATTLRQAQESFRGCMERLETQVLVEALRQADGNQTETARRLDMPRRTLVHKIKVLGIGRDEGESDG